MSESGGESFDAELMDTGGESFDAELMDSGGESFDAELPESDGELLDVENLDISEKKRDRKPSKNHDLNLEQDSGRPKRNRKLVQRLRSSDLTGSLNHAVGGNQEVPDSQPSQDLDANMEDPRDIARRLRAPNRGTGRTSFSERKNERGVDIIHNTPADIPKKPRGQPRVKRGGPRGGNRGRGRSIEKVAGPKRSAEASQQSGSNAPDAESRENDPQLDPTQGADPADVLDAARVLAGLMSDRGRTSHSSENDVGDGSVDAEMNIQQPPEMSAGQVMPSAASAVSAPPAVAAAVPAGGGALDVRPGVRVRFAPYAGADEIEGTVDKMVTNDRWAVISHDRSSEFTIRTKFLKVISAPTDMSTSAEAEPEVVSAQAMPVSSTGSESQVVSAEAIPVTRETAADQNIPVVTVQAADERGVSEDATADAAVWGVVRGYGDSFRMVSRASDRNITHGDIRYLFNVMNEIDDLNSEEREFLEILFSAQRVDLISCEITELNHTIFYALERLLNKVISTDGFTDKQTDICNMVFLCFFQYLLEKSNSTVPDQQIYPSYTVDEDGSYNFVCGTSKDRSLDMRFIKCKEVAQLLYAVSLTESFRHTGLWLLENLETSIFTECSDKCFEFFVRQVFSSLESVPEMPMEVKTSVDKVLDLLSAFRRKTRVPSPLTNDDLNQSTKLLLLFVGQEKLREIGLEDVFSDSEGDDADKMATGSEQASTATADPPETVQGGTSAAAADSLEIGQKDTSAAAADPPETGQGLTTAKQDKASTTAEASPSESCGQIDVQTSTGTSTGLSALSNLMGLNSGQWDGVGAPSNDRGARAKADQPGKASKSTREENKRVMHDLLELDPDKNPRIKHDLLSRCNKSTLEQLCKKRGIKCCRKHVHELISILSGIAEAQEATVGISSDNDEPTAAGDNSTGHNPSSAAPRAASQTKTQEFLSGLLSKVRAIRSAIKEGFTETSPDDAPGDGPVDVSGCNDLLDYDDMAKWARKLYNTLRKLENHILSGEYDRVDELVAPAMDFKRAIEEAAAIPKHFDLLKFGFDADHVQDRTEYISSLCVLSRFLEPDGNSNREPVAEFSVQYQMKTIHSYLAACLEKHIQGRGSKKACIVNVCNHYENLMNQVTIFLGLYLERGEYSGIEEELIQGINLRTFMGMAIRILNTFQDSVARFDMTPDDKHTLIDCIETMKTDHIVVLEGSGDKDDERNDDYFNSLDWTVHPKAAPRRRRPPAAESALDLPPLTEAELATWGELPVKDIQKIFRHWDIPASGNRKTLIERLGNTKHRSKITEANAHDALKSVSETGGGAASTPTSPADHVPSDATTTHMDPPPPPSPPPQAADSNSDRPTASSSTDPPPPSPQEKPPSSESAPTASSTALTQDRPNVAPVPRAGDRPQALAARWIPRPAVEPVNFLNRHMNLPGRFAASIDQGLFFNSNGERLVFLYSRRKCCIVLTTLSDDSNPTFDIAVLGVRYGEDYFSMWRMTVNSRFEITAADPENGRFQWIIDQQGQIHDYENVNVTSPDRRITDLRDPNGIVSPWFTVVYH